jgi:hypothetical protein
LQLFIIKYICGTSLVHMLFNRPGSVCSECSDTFLSNVQKIG